MRLNILYDSAPQGHPDQMVRIFLPKLLFGLFRLLKRDIW